MTQSVLPLLVEMVNLRLHGSSQKIPHLVSIEVNSTQGGKFAEVVNLPHDFDDPDFVPPGLLTTTDVIGILDEINSLHGSLAMPEFDLVHHAPYVVPGFGNANEYLHMTNKGEPVPTKPGNQGQGGD